MYSFSATLSPASRPAPSRADSPRSRDWMDDSVPTIQPCLPTTNRCNPDGNYRTLPTPLVVGLADGTGAANGGSKGVMIRAIRNGWAPLLSCLLVSLTSPRAVADGGAANSDSAAAP